MNPEDYKRALSSDMLQKLPKETQFRLTRKYRRALKVLQDSTGEHEEHL